MSIVYVKQIRQQVADAMAEAKAQGHKFIPVFWTGNHLNPVLIKLYIGR